MMIMCNTNVVTEYDIRRLGLSNAPLHMEYDNDSITVQRDIPSNIQYFYIRTCGKKSLRVVPVAVD